MKLNRRINLAAAVSFAVLFAGADPLLWYRFEGSGAIITNNASPGTMNGTLKSIDNWNDHELGDITAKFPTRGDDFPTKAGVYDHVSRKTISGPAKALQFSGDQASAGVVYMSNSDAAALKELANFTCEAFFKMPQNTYTNAHEANNFPLIVWGKHGEQGWKISFARDNKGNVKPLFRGVTRKEDGSKGVDFTLSDSQGTVGGCADGEWHHLAVTVDGKEDGSTMICRLYLDYKEIFSTNLEEYCGFYYNDSDAVSFVIGADLYRNVSSANTRETFMGDVADLRITPEALPPESFLRAVRPGLMFTVW